MSKSIMETRQEQDAKVKQLVDLFQTKSIRNSIDFTTKVIEFIAQETKAYQGVFYVCYEETQQVCAKGVYATSLKKDFDYGEGLVGQVVLSKRSVYFHNPSVNQNLSGGIRQFSPNTAIILPLLFNQKVYGVIELVFIQSLPNHFKAFLERVSGYISASLYNLLANEITENLLQDSQVQTKELQNVTQRQKMSMTILEKAREKLAKQQKELHQEHIKTKNSIQYAKKIQGAFLPTKSTRLAIFPESFLLYLPKDIVSGDFFWCSEHGKRRIVAVADCTGHGVPGAFMSVVGSNLMNEIVNQQDITCPATILSKMHQGIREKLRQDESQNDDGMDMTVCMIEPDKHQKYRLTFAGAKHFMIIVDQHNQLRTLKGDRQSIGGRNTTDNRLFTNQETFVDSTEMIYLFSDGYIDQPKANRRSLGRARLEKLLLSVAKLPVQTQKERITNFLEKYKQDTPQRDDITLFGISI